MRQADGSELLGAGDPRAEEIGVIYVAPTDERKDVLTAILTQEKLGRKQIAIVLPEQNRAFQRRVDFEVLKMRRNPQARLIFIAPPRSEPAEYARQRRFPVYSSLDNYVRSLQDMWEEGKAEEGQGPAWSQRLRRLLRLRERESAGGGGGEGERAATGAEQQASDVRPEPSRPAFRGTSLGGAAAAGAAGAAAGLSWSALQREQERKAGTAGGMAEPAEEPAEEQGPDRVGAGAGPFQEEEEDEELPPVERARFSPAPAAATPAGTGTGARQEPAPATPSEEESSSPISPAAAGAAGLAAGAAAVAAEEGRQKQGPDEARASAAPPRTPAANAGPGIIQFPHSRRITAKLPTASNAYAPDAEAARRGSSPQSGRGAAAAAGAGALAGAAAGMALAGSSSGAGGGGGTASGPAGGAAAMSASGVSTVPPPWTPPRQQRRRQRRRGVLWLALVAILLLLLLIGCGALAAVNPKLLGPVAAMMPFGTPGATVTITPASVDLKNQYLITGVTGTPDPAQRQIQARVLTAAPAAQTKTVQATGHGQTPGVQARGTITFTHSGGTWESVLSGTTFTLQNGLKIVTDARVDLPPQPSPSQPVSRSAPAHVVQPGSVGNLPAGAISNQLCCGATDIYATSSAFTGGQDPQSYTFVQQSDIDSAANPLKASLAQQAQQQFQRQLRAGEQLISQPTCSTNVKSDHQAGDHVTSATVTVSASCSGEAFDKQAALRLGANLLSQEASKSLGAGYAPVGQVMTNISGATPISSGASKGSISITVTAEGRWAYQFDSADKESLARLIAGKTRSEALQLLQRQNGIKEADIAIAHGSDRLPSDANQISITINSVSGLTPAPSASIGPGPTSSPTAAPTAPSPGNNTPTSGKG
ncbi:hypothetical protein [Thermogemmatispora carboxidivorans]|uniref:hypothetical protein n=1 Tax=Thermogemmatispora carboxidivorans TaxID=1382306 RepID=UPI00069AD051|nr:hypothetical protein [Thermogemmatispora carboxidivorans]